MRMLLLTMILSSSMLGAAPEQNWNKIFGLSCSQVRLDGKDVSNRSFAIYRVVGKESVCCDAAALVYEGRTKRFGYFLIGKELEPGYYFFAFEAKKMKLIVPLQMGKKKYVTKSCEEPTTIIRAKSDGTATIDQFIIVD
ncbi:MAG TPA: hypothetical protein VGQ94_03180 [Terriglobales bacterium]|nr:hypothetical protein [Terriglobales bacterium]